MKELNLQNHRKKLGLTVRQMAAKIAMTPSQLSKIENEFWPKDLDTVIRICDAYHLNYKFVERKWLFTFAKSPKTRDHLAKLLSTSDGQGPVPLDESKVDLQRIAALEGLAEDKWLRKAALGILETLRKYQKNVGMELKKGATLISRQEALAESRYTPIFKGGLVKAQRILVTSRPIRFLVELHWFPPRVAGYHTQPHSGPVKPGIELFTVISGSGLLIRHHENTSWETSQMEIGCCGWYAGGEEHIWINTSHHEPLIMNAIFFPLPSGRPKPTIVRSDGSAEVEPGRGDEFILDLIPARIPEDIQREIRLSLARNKNRFSAEANE